MYYGMPPTYEDVKAVNFSSKSCYENISYEPKIMIHNKCIILIM